MDTFPENLCNFHVLTLKVKSEGTLGGIRLLP